MLCAADQGHSRTSEYQREMSGHGGLVLLVLGVVIVVLKSGPALYATANFYGKRGNPPVYSLTNCPWTVTLSWLQWVRGT